MDNSVQAKHPTRKEWKRLDKHLFYFVFQLLAVFATEGMLPSARLSSN